MRRFALAASLLTLTMSLGAQPTQPPKGQPPTTAAAKAKEPGTTPPATLDTAAWSRLKWRHIGPEGNRVTSVSGVIGDRHTYYAGAASGGMWKTTDGGVHWTPIFDKQLVSSVSAIAVAPSDANVVWAGTGESFIRSHISAGWGIFKSTDAGANWTKAGLDNTGRIARVIVHPTNPDIVWVAALGFAYGPQQERGVYRTTDGGKTWGRTLFVNDSTGAIDLAIDPSNPRTLYAATWQVEIHTWGRESGGAGSGIWKSTDGGATWKRLTKGLPTQPVGKIGLAVARSNPQRVYALIETSDGVPVYGREASSGELFRSDDGGESWSVASYDRQLGGRTQYYSRMAVAPDNDLEAYFLAANWSKTVDGGKTTIDPPNAEIPGGDHHDIWIDPTDANRMIVSHDGGISITENRGKTWLRQQLAIAQMYHVTVDDRIPYWVYGNRQDGPSARGPSNSRTRESGVNITRGMWQTVGGGESGWATPDPVDSNIVWSSASGFGSVGGIVTRLDLRTMQRRDVEVWPMATIGWPADSLRYRFVWTFPLTISPHDHNTVYVGSQHVHTTSDGGQTWRELSPDLTRNDKTHQRMSGGLTPDNIGVEYAGVVFAIAESRVKKGLIWAGTNDGRVHLTRDGGATWTDVSAGLTGAPSLGTISNIEPSRFDEGTAYLAVDGHQVNDRDPHIFKTTDFGKTWRAIVNGIPRSPLSYAHVVRADPVRRGMLYAGTENGIYVSWDDGASWRPLQANLPHAPVYWVTVQERFNDLVIATYGRGFWILDDVTALRTLPEAVPNEANLFAPRAAYRLRDVEAPYAAGEDPTEGTNPPAGVPLHYWLRAAVKDTTKDSASVEIRDAANALVRTLKVPQVAGLSRVWWDLRYDQSKEAKLRTQPLFVPQSPYGPEGKKAPQLTRVALLAPPGTYTVKVTLAGKTFTQPLTILRDPSAAASSEDLAQQIALARAVQSDLDSTVATINAVELARAQLASLRALLNDDSTAADLRAQSDSVDKRLVAVEEPLIQLRITGRGQDVVRYPMQLAERLEFLFGSVTGTDYGPTAAQREVATLLHAQLLAARARVLDTMRSDVEPFRAKVRERRKDIVISM